MKRCMVLSAICVLSGLMIIGCQRDEGVQAGNEGDTETYQPRPVPSTEPDTTTGAQTQEMNGELTQVDTSLKTISVRLENGMMQTFKFGDSTSIQGTRSNAVSDLAGKEGSKVTVRWTEEGGAKMATGIEVH